DYLGVYLSGHPSEPYLAAIPDSQRTDVANLTVGMSAATVIIYIQNVKKIRTKKGDPMAFVDGIDLTGTLSITIFPKLFKEISPLLVNEKVLLITGKIEQQRGRDALQMIANRIVSGDELLARTPNSAAMTPTGQWYLRIMASAEDAGVMPILQTNLQRHHGVNPVLLVFERNHRKIALDETYWLADDEKTTAAMQARLGKNNVVFKKTP